MRKIFFIFLISVTFLANGCGYTTTSLLPKELDSIHVENFINKVNPAGEISNRRMTYLYQPGLENDITRSVIDEFIFDRFLEIQTKSGSALLMTGELVDLQQYSLSYDNDDNVEEYRIEVFVNLKLYNQITGKLMWAENRFMGQTDYPVSGPNAITESRALKNAVKDLSKRIVERTVEAW